MTGPPARPTGLLSPRLTLAPEGVAPHRINGAWWPRSRDLHHELPGLLRVLLPRWGTITHLTAPVGMWRLGGTWLPVQGEQTRIRRSEDAETRHTVCLLSHRGGCCDLFVVPPSAGSAEAELLMAVAGRADTPPSGASAFDGIRSGDRGETGTAGPDHR